MLLPSCMLSFLVTLLALRADLKYSFKPGLDNMNLDALKFADVAPKGRFNFSVVKPVL